MEKSGPSHPHSLYTLACGPVYKGFELLGFLECLELSYSSRWLVEIKTRLTLILKNFDLILRNLDLIFKNLDLIFKNLVRNSLYPSLGVSIKKIREAREKSMLKTHHFQKYLRNPHSNSKFRVSASEAFQKTTFTEVSNSKNLPETSGFRTETSCF
jgi:hypothetical protein